MKKAAIVLSGCGYKDGSEVTEAVSTLIAISEAGLSYRIFAPDIQIASTDHLTGEPSGSRSALKEAARIARGKIEDLKKLHPDDFDAVVFPGGYGAALHLCSFAKDGALGQVLPEIKKIIEAFHADSKPIGALCIAPALIACVLGQHGVTVTIGNDKATAQEIEKTGAQHVDCAVDDFITDREHKVVSTPGYMYDDAKPHEIFTGIRRAIKELAEMA